MKNNIGSKKIISIVLMILLLFTTKVYAVNDSFSTTIKASNSSLKREDTITITIGLKDISIESGEKGIGAYTASIKFDSSILEYVEANGTAKWEAPFYQNGLITGHTKDGEVVNSTQSIGTITFKVKKDAKLGETTIKLTNFSGSTIEKDVSTSDKSIKITIIDNNSNNENKDNNNSDKNNNNNNNNNSDKNNENNNNNNDNDNESNNNDNNNQNTENNNSSNNNKTNTIKNPSTSNVIDNSIKEGVLPKTGVTDIIIFTIIGICILLVIILFIRMILLNKKRR